MKKEKVVVLGGGGFIGGHLAKTLKNAGYYVRIADIKYHEFFNQEDICHEFIKCDLREKKAVDLVCDGSISQVFQLAADMGGAGYIFTGDNDANVMHNSSLINLNVVHACSTNKISKVFYSSSACMYPAHNQIDPQNPNCKESSAYPANPDSEYGWEKLFSERLFLAFQRNYNLDVRVARFHNIFGPYGTWDGGKEKAPAAMLRKAAETEIGSNFEVWGPGNQTRSFLYIDECIEMILKQMNSDFIGPVNIGSEEMVSINKLAEMAISISNKKIGFKNIQGDEFFKKYGFKCPVGVAGRNSDNKIYKEKIGWEPTQSLFEGLELTYPWILEQVQLKNS